MQKSVLGLLAVALISGCGSDGGGREKTVPLTGVLLVDGSPKGGASISFVPQSADGGVRTAYAQTEEDGSFAATTYVTGDGIVPGKYEISLSNGADMSSTDPSKMMAAVQGTNVKTSEIDVPADGLTDIEIKLVSDSGGNGNAGPGMLGL